MSGRPGPLEGRSGRAREGLLAIGVCRDKAIRTRCQYRGGRVGNAVKQKSGRGSERCLRRRVHRLRPSPARHWLRIAGPVIERTQREGSGGIEAGSGGGDRAGGSCSSARREVSSRGVERSSERTCLAPEPCTGSSSRPTLLKSAALVGGEQCAAWSLFSRFAHHRDAQEVAWCEHEEREPESERSTRSGSTAQVKL